MTQTLTTRECTPQDKEAVLALFRKHFGSWSAERWSRRWQWQYHGDRGCDKCGSFIQVAESGGTVVGHIGAFPLPLRLGDERIDVLCAADFVVEKEHRLAAFSLLKNLVAKNDIVLGTSWSPAAAKLFRFYGAEALALSAVRYIYPLRYFNVTRRELRSRLPASLHWMSNRWCTALATRVMDRRRGRTSKPVPRVDSTGRIQMISRFGGDYNRLWRSFATRFEMSLDKDATYLNWRYVDCPTLDPVCLGYYDQRGELVGVIIACRRVHRDVKDRPCGADAEIAELIVEDCDRGIAQALVTQVVEHMSNERIDTVTARGLALGLHSTLEDVGFDRSTVDWGTLLLTSKMRVRSVETILKDELWYVTSGDGDSLFDEGA